MEQQTILIVDDDREIVRVIAKILELEGYRTLKAYDGLEALDMLVSNVVHLIMIDIMMPKMNGLAAVMKIRETNNIPIIILSAKTEETDKVLGLSMGADDYIVKPFLLSVLLSRVRAVLRRSTRAAEKGKLTCGDISMDTEKMKAYLGTEEVVLTAGELRLLRVLMENKNQAITRNRLLELLWDADGNFVNDNTLTVTMKRLREKMNNPKQIQTLRGIGYRMEETGENG